jgi:lipoate-protein ligase A
MMDQNVAESSLDPEEQLTLDWTTLQAVERGAAGASARAWRTTRPLVVVGRHGRIADEVIEEHCQQDQVRVARRVSGGGAVVLGPGCINYAIVLPLDWCPRLTETATSFHLVLATLSAALDVPGLTIEGGSDLALHGRKVSGNAQRRGRYALLHHGTLLYDFDPGLAARYLKEPIRRPAYRRARPHREFIGNLPLSAATIEARLEAAWAALRLSPAVTG